MSRSHFMSWVTSAVVHTGMLAIFGTALMALPVVAPEVAGHRIVMMSSRAEVASSEAVLRTVEYRPVRVVESSKESELLPRDPVPPLKVESVAVSDLTPSPEPLEVVVASVKVPNLLQRRQSKQSRSNGQRTTPSELRQRSPQAADSESLEAPVITRHQPDVPDLPDAMPIELPPTRRPKPATLQPASASTARQPSANSVAQAVGTTPTKPARAISNPNPVYPPEAVQQQLEGLVTLSVTIAASGEVTKVTVAESCGHEVLDQAALDAVCQWQFSPATQGGKPVEWTARLPIRFRL